MVFSLAAMLWIYSSLISVLAIINFIGLLEIILALSVTAVIDETLGNLIILGFTLRILYLSAQILIVILNYSYNIIKTKYLVS